MGTSEALLPTVTLRPMTEQEYDDYRQRSVPAYAADLERARGLNPETALEESDKTFAKTLAETHQGRSLGRATMLAAEQLAREAGLRHIALNVFGWNSRAETLYRSLGYVTGLTQMSKPLQEQP